MEFQQAAERIRQYGLGLTHDASSGALFVMRGFTVVHRAANIDDALGFARAWALHVR